MTSKRVKGPGTSGAVEACAGTTWRDRCLAAVREPRTDPSIVKVCPACGRAHTDDSWQRLPVLGVIEPEAGTWAELRNCACGSTIARRVRIEVAS